MSEFLKINNINNTNKTIETFDVFIDKFLEFKSLKIDKVNENDKILHEVLSNLDNKEIEFALKMYEKTKNYMLLKNSQTGQKGGAFETVIFKEEDGIVTVISTQRKKFVYYILNIFLILLIYSIISSLFQNTLTLQRDLITSKFNLIKNEIKNPTNELSLMNDYIEQLEKLTETVKLIDDNTVISTMNHIEPFMLNENNIIKSLESEETLQENNMLSLFSSFYYQIKTYIQFEPLSHIPDMTSIMTSYEETKTELESISKMNNGLISTVQQLFTTVDKTQQKMILLQQMVNLFPMLIASYSLKITRITSEVTNIHSLIYAIIYRLFLMFAISKFVHISGNKLITNITDINTIISLNDYNNKLEEQDKKDFKNVVKILYKELGKSNISKEDKNYITKEILNQFYTIIQQPNLNEYIKDLIDEIATKLDPNEVPLITNGEKKGGKPRRQTRRKIRRNKKAKTKKKKTNKKTKKRKTKINRKKSKKRRTKK